MSAAVLILPVMHKDKFTFASTCPDKFPSDGHSVLCCYMKNKIEINTYIQNISNIMNKNKIKV